MQDPGRMLCPFCRKELPEPTNWCWHCGSDLHGMKLARPRSQSRQNVYSIVPDGFLFGIALGGEIKLHGLDSKSAERLLEILNSLADLEETG